MKEALTHIEIQQIEDIKPYIKQLTKLYIDAYKGLERYAYTKPKDVRGYIEWLFRRDKNGFFVAFDQKGKPIGFLGADSNWVKNGYPIGEIHELVVSPHARGKGLGKALIEQALQYFKEKGLKRSGLWVGEHNLKAKKLYMDCGFKEVGKKGKWIRMERDLS